MNCLIENKFDTILKVIAVCIIICIKFAICYLAITIFNITFPVILAMMIGLIISYILITLVHIIFFSLYDN
jgi:hypothetical protein